MIITIVDTIHPITHPSTRHATTRIEAKEGYVLEAKGAYIAATKAGKRMLIPISNIRSMEEELPAPVPTPVKVESKKT